MLKTITLPGESLLPVKIVFMRHGKPLLPASGWIAPAGMGAWIRAYDLAEVVREDVPGDGPALARSVSFLVSSSSPRALASARQVGRTPSIVDDIYCEAPLPFAEWRFPRLPPKIWACFFRILWFLGYAHGAFLLNTLMVQQLVDRATTADTRYTPSTAKREVGKHETQAMYESWRKAYRALKRKHPGKSDVWYSQQISKTHNPLGRKASTIKKNMLL